MVKGTKIKYFPPKGVEMKLVLPTIALLLAFSAISSAQEAKCDYSVKIITQGTEFDSKNFSWKMIAFRIEGNGTKINGTARIEQGKMLKNYNPWTSEAISKQKTSSSYSPTLQKGEYKLIAKIKTECDDKNTSNNVDSMQIRIKAQDIQVKQEANPVNQTNFEEEKTIYLSPIEEKNEEIIYKSTNQKSGELVLISLLAFSIFLNIVLIWKR